MAHAFIFPGQGSQTVGMGRDLASFPAAAEIFSEVDDTLGMKLSKIMFEGPAEELTLTANAQPALMAVSMAVLAVLRAEGIELESDVRYVAGHSLGEYSALCAVGSLSLRDTTRLLKIRGNSMQAAVPVGEGAMAALLGLTLDDVLEIVAEAAQGQVCQAANDNAPGQIVISGSRFAVERAIQLAKLRGGKKAVFLPVSAPFHCALMQPAADCMAQALSEVTIAPPVVPLVSNVTARPIHTPEEIRRNLIAQVTASVRWRESIEWLASGGVTEFVEVGAGKVLSGLVRRIVPDKVVTFLNTPDEILSFARR